jgi:hypothetical protein
MWRLRWALRRFKQVSPRERRLIAEAIALLPLVHALQTCLPFKRWRALLEEIPLRRLREDPATVDQIAWAVEAARKWLPGEYKCLPGAYAAHLMLRRHGHASQVHVGVGHDAAGRVEAHAWVDCQGRTVIGLVENMERFVPFPPLEAAPLGSVSR